MEFAAPDQLLRVGGAADLSVTWVDQNGTALAPSGAVTVRVQTADGTDLLTAGHSTTGTNPYFRALTAVQNATLEQLTATWTAAGDGTTRTTVIDIVGDFLFSLDEVRAFDKTLEDQRKYPDAKILRVRREVEEECFDITGWSFTPRYRRVALDGTGERTLVLPDTPISTIRSLRTYTSPGVYTPASDFDLAGLKATNTGKLVLPRGSAFYEGDQNIVFEYEHGFARPPEDLKHAALARCRYRLNMEKSIDSSAAARFITDGNGNLIDVGDDLPIEQKQVFRVYRRYERTASQAASGIIEFQPSRNSVFHGGRR